MNEQMEVGIERASIPYVVGALMRVDDSDAAELMKCKLLCSFCSL